MANFFKTGNEFNKVAHCFGNMYSSINELQPLLEIYTDNLEQFKTLYKTDILILALIAHKGIIRRMDEYGWELEAKIMIPAISIRRITILNAWTLTISKMVLMIEIMDQWSYLPIIRKIDASKTQELVVEINLHKIQELYDSNEKYL